MPIHRCSSSVLMRLLILPLLVISLFSLPIIGTHSASASQIVCSEAGLIAAINAANSAGSGVIELPPACTISLTGTQAGQPFDGPGPTGLPLITGNVTIYGGAIRRNVSAPFRLFAVQNGGRLNLINTTLNNGLAKGGDGANGVAGTYGVAGGGGGGGMGYAGVGGYGVGGGGGGSAGPGVYSRGPVGGAGGPGVRGGGQNGGDATNGGAGANGGGGGSNGAGGAGGYGGGGGGGSGAQNGGVGGVAGGGGGGGGFQTVGNGAAGGFAGGTGGNGGVGGTGGKGGGGGGGGGGGLGGAIFIDTGAVVSAANTTFSSNKAQGGSGGPGYGPDIGPGDPGGGNGGGGGSAYGGAIFNSGTFCGNNNTFSGNTVTAGTGGVGAVAGIAGSTGNTDLDNQLGGTAPACTATTTTTIPASAFFSASTQNVALSATVASPGSVGSVNFSVYSSTNTQIGSSVSGTVASGSASASFALPGGTPIGAYTIRAIYVPAGSLSGSVGTATLTIANSAPTITLNPTTLPKAGRGNPYSQTITASGGTAPYTYSVTVGTLPSGLTLSTAGVLSGIPKVVGSSSFTVQAKDASNATGTQAYTLQVNVADTIGTFSNGVFSLRNTNTAGVADITVNFGFGASDLPVVGDWNGDGIDTVGVYISNIGVFALRDSNTAGGIDYAFVMGNPGDEPIAGKWDNTMTHDGIGVYRPSNGLLFTRKTLTNGFADYTMVLGNPGDHGIAGDWDGNGYDSVGVYRPSATRFYLANGMAGTTDNPAIIFSDYDFAVGPSTLTPLAGDWTGSGVSRAAFVVNGTFNLKYTFTDGGGDNNFAYGTPGERPIAGKWIPASQPLPSGSAAANVIVVPPTPPTDGKFD